MSVPRMCSSRSAPVTSVQARAGRAAFLDLGHAGIDGDANLQRLILEIVFLRWPAVRRMMG